MKTLLIALVNLGDFLHAVVSRAVGNFREFVRVLRLVLRLADDGQAQPRRKHLLIHVEVLQNVLDHALRVGGIIDRKA